MHWRKDVSSHTSWIHYAIFASIWIVALGSSVYQKIQYHRTMHTLTQELPVVLQQANARSLTTFVIYPSAGKPVGTPVVLTLPDPLIDAFFEALNDARSYAPSGVTVTSPVHNWFIEIMIGNERLQIRCYIPSNEHSKMVVGEFIGWNGSFQSRQLYQWYQTYSHRWLTPEGSPSAPPP